MQRFGRATLRVVGEMPGTSGARVDAGSVVLSPIALYRGAGNGGLPHPLVGPRHQKRTALTKLDFRKLVGGMPEDIQVMLQQRSGIVTSGVRIGVTSLQSTWPPSCPPPVLARRATPRLSRASATLRCWRGYQPRC